MLDFLDAISYTWNLYNKDTGNVSTSDISVALTVPSEATRIIAIIPFGFDPSVSWDGTVVWKTIDLVNKVAGVRIVAPSTLPAQNYNLRYWVVWK